MTARGYLKHARHVLLTRAEGERILKERFAKLHGGGLNMKRPVTFTEKLYCRMIEVNRTGDSVMTALVDKFAVRTYVETTVGAAHLPRLIWHGTDPRAIPFRQLPSRCVIKTNHGSAMNIRGAGDLNERAAIRQLRKWMSESFYFFSREYQYHAIEPRIMIEELLDDGHPDGPLDYRFWCFDGHVEAIQVDNNTHGINPFYDSSWTRIPGGYREKARDVDIDRPKNLEAMLAIASSLSHSFDFVRVDLYDLKDRIVFGELTFTPTGGTAKFDPPSWETRLGRCWNYRPLSRNGYSFLSASR